ncbi:hypothetical protein SESBI_06067 [Sesbania bispinosa]|nr:hypothetical protein SESBI_06067 [Sesbania bispinosa]
MTMKSDVMMEPKPLDGNESSLNSRASFREDQDPLQLLQWILVPLEISSLEVTVTHEGNTMENQDIVVHGDWMVVTRSRRNNQVRGKGKGLIKSYPGNLTVGDLGSLSSKDSDHSKGVKDVTIKPFQENASLVFNSGGVASSSKSDNRKKRHKIDLSSKSNQDNVNQKTIVFEAVVPGTKDTSKKGFKPFIPAHSIQTIWNVDVIAANRLRFKDEDKPSDSTPPISVEKNSSKGKASTMDRTGSKEGVNDSINENPVLSWNVRGAASKKSHRHIRDALRKFKPNLVFILETRT